MVKLEVVLAQLRDGYDIEPKNVDSFVVSLYNSELMDVSFNRNRLARHIGSC